MDTYYRFFDFVVLYYTLRYLKSTFTIVNVTNITYYLCLVYIYNLNLSLCLRNVSCLLNHV